MFKRDGYGLFQALGSGQAIHGGYHFQQLGGSDVQVWGSSTSLYGIVSDGTAVILATGTLNTTWQCTDSQGKAYCFTAAGDTPIQTDGTKANTIFFSSAPSGTMATFTPLQLVVAGVSGNANTIYISAQLAFNNFVVGTLPSSPFTEPIASPGSRITHLAYYFGRLFWWKDQSFGYATFTGQNDWQLTIVSNQVGTTDNSDAFWNSSGFDSGTMFSGTQQANAYTSPGGIFFRGQDNHVYVYDGYYLTRLSRIITPTVGASSKQKANAWTQTTQADFQTGSIVPTANLSTTISPGDVIVSSFSTIENSSTQWTSGSTNNTTVFPSSITLSTNNSGNITNPDFESSFIGNWTGSPGLTKRTSYTQNSCTINPQSGSSFALGNDGSSFVSIWNLQNIGLSTQTVNSGLTRDCTWHQYTLTDNADIGKRVKIVVGSSSGLGNNISTTSDSYIWGGSLTIYAALSDAASKPNVAFDNIQNGSSTVTSGSFTSQVYNTGFTSATYSLSNFAWTANTSTPTFSLQTSIASNGVFTTLLTSSGTNAIGNQYAQYVSTISIGATDNALTSITSVSILAQSTGTYYSSVHNAPNLSTWGTFTVDQVIPGVSSITYYTRSSANTFTVLSSTPSWTLQPINGTVATSTGTYMQLRGDFSLSAATEAPTLNDFTLNWFEGAASDKAYIGYFNDAIWFSVSSSSSVSTNNTIFYWDLLNGAWSIYNIPSNGLLVENNALYIGDPTNSNIYKFGGVTTDNGSAIQSYWRSKSFLFNESETSGNGQTISFPATDDIFVQKEFTQADFVLGESSSTLSYTYTLDSKTSTVFTMTAFDSSASLIQRNFLLPVGKIGKYYDFQIGDNSTLPAWKMIAHRVHYNALNWRPVLQ